MIHHIYKQIPFSVYPNAVKVVTAVVKLSLLQHEYKESNSSPRNQEIKNLSCCQWNVNNLLAQNLWKTSQTEPCNSLYDYDLISISEKYFDSSVLCDRSFQLHGYSLIRADDPSNTKWGGVFNYYKEMSLGIHMERLSNLIQHTCQH